MNRQYFGPLFVVQKCSIVVLSLWISMFLDPIPPFTFHIYISGKYKGPLPRSKVQSLIHKAHMTLFWVHYGWYQVKYIFLGRRWTRADVSQGVLDLDIVLHLTRKLWWGCEWYLQRGSVWIDAQDFQGGKLFRVHWKIFCWEMMLLCCHLEKRKKKAEIMKTRMIKNRIKITSHFKNLNNNLPFLGRSWWQEKWQGKKFQTRKQWWWSWCNHNYKILWKLK